MTNSPRENLHGGSTGDHLKEQISEVSTRLPEGWTTSSALDCFDQIATSNKKVKTKECLDAGLFPVIDQGQHYIAGYVNDSDKVIAVDDPIIIFGDHTRVVKWVTHDFVPGADGTKVLKPRPFINGRFSYLQLRSLEIHDRGYSRHFQFLKKNSFLLPPLNEQIRIANKLDSLLAKVDAAQARLEKIPTLLKRFRQSVLAAAMSGELTREWRFSHPESSAMDHWLSTIEEKRQNLWADECTRVNRKRKYKLPEIGLSDGLHEIPSNWCWKSVDFLASKVVDGVHKKPNYQSDGIPFVTVKNMTAGSGISFENLNYITRNDHIDFFKRANPQRDDILISKDGTLGVVRKVNTDAEFSIFVSVALVKPVLKQMSSYLEIAFSSPTLQSQMMGVGTGLQHIHLTDLRKDMVPVPPMEEQYEIVRRVEALFDLADTVEKQYLEAKQRTDRLTQSLLAKAFRGELVPQDPNDEPAAELLRRIQGEREAQPKKTQAKKAPNRADMKNKATKVNKMKLADAPENYLSSLLAYLDGEADAEELWKKSELNIDDFYAKLKQEINSHLIVDDNSSADPSLRKLKSA